MTAASPPPHAMTRLRDEEEGRRERVEAREGLEGQAAALCGGGR